jgi:hypothetical protein
LGIVVFRQWQLRREPAPQQSAADGEDARERAAAPADATAPAPPPLARAEKPVATKPTAFSSDWAVVAAIYNNYEAAERRAREIEKRWKGDVTVFPAKGEGRRYMVVVGTATTRQDAERLLTQGRSLGLPRDTYVTKIIGLR